MKKKKKQNRSNGEHKKCWHLLAHSGQIVSLFHTYLTDFVHYYTSSGTLDIVMFIHF